MSKLLLVPTRRAEIPQTLRIKTTMPVAVRVGADRCRRRNKRFYEQACYSYEYAAPNCGLAIFSRHINSIYLLNAPPLPPNTHTHTFSILLLRHRTAADQKASASGAHSAPHIFLRAQCGRSRYCTCNNSLCLTHVLYPLPPVSADERGTSNNKSSCDDLIV